MRIRCLSCGVVFVSDAFYEVPVHRRSLNCRNEQCIGSYKPITKQHYDNNPQSVDSDADGDGDGHLDRQGLEDERKAATP